MRALTSMDNSLHAQHAKAGAAECRRVGSRNVLGKLAVDVHNAHVREAY